MSFQDYAQDFSDLPPDSKTNEGDSIQISHGKEPIRDHGNGHGGNSHGNMRVDDNWQTSSTNSYRQQLDNFTQRCKPPQQQSSMNNHNGQSQQGAAIMQDPAPKPPRWVLQLDQVSQRYYYIQTTGVSQWEPPAVPQAYQTSVPQAYGIDMTDKNGVNDRGQCQKGINHSIYADTMRERGMDPYGNDLPSHEQSSQTATTQEAHESRAMPPPAGRGLTAGTSESAAVANDGSGNEHDAPAALARRLPDYHGSASYPAKKFRP